LIGFGDANWRADLARRTSPALIDLTDQDQLTNLTYPDKTRTNPTEPGSAVSLRPHFTLSLPGGRSLVLGPRCLVMGILNVTPDSFADGGLWTDPSRAIDAALRMEAEGADFIDVGGESTRPGAEALSQDDELARVMPVIDALAGRLQIPISIDTYKAAVAERAIAAGAAIVNDISALEYDPALSAVVASTGAALVLMHNRGRSRDMYREAQYGDVVAEVRDELAARVRTAVAAGIRREQLIVDPGIGFAKHATHSLALLARLPELAALGLPVLVGPSRKSFLRLALGDRAPSDRDWGTAAAVATAVLGGAHIVRVHDVKAMADVARTVDGIVAAGR
jgi:dihydropteroate synthase